MFGNLRVKAGETGVEVSSGSGYCIDKEAKYKAGMLNVSFVESKNR